ncbi:cupredoxin domain-containing protein [Methylobacterium planeticum]|uniref:Anaerobic typically selenocysteine-containing protein n=1 Tax=Methylobacterium planeticum TaxID=2615211 RepID=A0A6N6MVD8_9HYPH|nr:anaerobic typically selenocysteine-containing protein [Methylobacterium planeticum]KAB1074453.1 anaerobic typically selenocysteine-containing protein [Methylobacterium planeticum]
MRRTLFGLGTLAALLSAQPAFAEGKPLAPPASDAMPPVELTITMKDGKPVCAPAELLLPADTNVALHVISRADAPITITMGEQFENGRVLHADGDLVHVMSEKGYSVKRNGQGTLRLRTMKAGTQDYACTSNRNQDAPFTGKLTLSPPAG